MFIFLIYTDYSKFVKCYGKYLLFSIYVFELNCTYIRVIFDNNNTEQKTF